MRSRNAVLLFVGTLAISSIFIIVGFGNGVGGRGHGMNGMIPQSLWLVLMGIPLVAGISVIGYALVFPEIREKKPEETQSHVTVDKKGESTLDAVLRVLKEDERKVIETIVATDRTMLQKDIRWKLGFSRVKTHRIIYRLAERGIVSVEKYYNTNKITLADWLIK